MKTILILLTLMITIVTSVASFNLFADGTYYISAVLTVAAYLSASTFVYLLINHKKVALHS